MSTVGTRSGESEPHAGAPLRAPYQPLDATDHRHQHHADDRRDDQRRPDLNGLPVVGPAQQAGADTGLRAGRQFADDRPDQAGGDGDLEAGEQKTGRRRPAQLPEHLRRAGAVGSHQVELQRIGRAQALDHPDGHREEAQIHRDDRLGQQSPLSPRLPSTTTTIGAMARIGTVCDAMTQGSRLRSSTRECTIPTARTNAQQRTEQEAEHGRRDRHAGVIDQAALALDRRHEHRLRSRSAAIWCGAGSTGRSIDQVPRAGRARSRLFASRLEAFDHAAAH